MRTFIRETLLCFLIVCCVCCTKNEPARETVAPPVYDSIVKISSISSVRNGTTLFYYDEVSHRYKSFAWHHSTTASNWDSTIINYNSNGVAASYLTIYPMPNGDNYCYATILSFDATGKISKKYKKKSIALSQYTSSYTSDVSDRAAINFYDSLGYDDHNRFAFAYRIYDDPAFATPYKPSYRKFYYSTASDTNFNKIEYYDLDVNSHFRLKETMSFLSFDGKPNPLKDDFAVYGLLQPFITTFCLHPTEHGSFSTYFLTAFPFNCNQLSFVDPVAAVNINEQLTYTYTAEGLPLTVAGNADPSNVQSFSYRKYRKY